jgi:hypothetical protein
MPIFRDTVSGLNNGTAESSGTYTVNMTIGNNADRLLVAGISHASDTNGVFPTSVTWDGVALTEYNRTAILDGGSPSQSYDGLWYLKAPATGNKTFSVSIVSNGSLSANLASYYGVDQTTPIRGGATISGLSDVAAITLNSALGDVIIDDLGTYFHTNPSTNTASGIQHVRVRRQQGPSVGSNYDSLNLMGETPGLSSNTIGWDLSTDGDSTRNNAYTAISLVPSTAGIIFGAEAHNAKGVSNTNPMSITLNVPTGLSSAHADVIIRMIGGPPQTTATTYNGANMTLKSRNQGVTDTSDTLEHWYLSLGSPVTGNITITATPTAACRMIGWATIRGKVSQSSPFFGADNYTESTGAGTALIVNTLASSAGNLVVDGSATSGLRYPVYGSGQMARTQYSPSDDIVGSEKDSGTSVTMTWDIRDAATVPPGLPSANTWYSVAWTLMTAAGATNDRTISGLTNVASASSQYGIPNSDITLGNWISSSTEALYATISGLISGDPKYIYSPNTASNSSEVKLSNLFTPISVSGHVVTIHVKADNPSCSLVVGLYQGAALIQQETFTNLTTSFATRGFLVTPANVATITDYTNLRLRFTAGP